MKKTGEIYIGQYRHYVLVSNLHIPLSKYKHHLPKFSISDNFLVFQTDNTTLDFNQLNFVKSFGYKKNAIDFVEAHINI